MKSLVLEYDEVNSSIETLNEFSFDDIAQLISLGLICDPGIIAIYDYVKHKRTGTLTIPSSSTLTQLPNWLTKVYDTLRIDGSNIEDIPDSLAITNSIHAGQSRLKEFRRSAVYGYLNLDHTQITRLPNNLKVGGYLSVDGIQFEEIPKNLEVYGDFFISGSNLAQFTSADLYQMYTIKGRIIER